MGGGGDRGREEEGRDKGSFMKSESGKKLISIKSFVLEDSPPPQRRSAIENKFQRGLECGKTQKKLGNLI